MPIPPDNRVPGDDGHVTDHNAISDELTALAARNYAGLLTPTAVKTSAYTASAGDFVPVDTTSGNVTVTLPSAPADMTVVAVKHVIQGGTNTVTIARGGSDVFNKTGGATSGTLTLLAQGMLLQYKASGGIWYVIADDLPLSQLDSRYAQVFSPVAFGAKGDGTTDDTTALQNCAAAAIAASGIIDLGTSTYKISSPVNITTGFHMRGAGYQGGTIISSASDLFTVGSSVFYVTFEDCNFTSSTGGGHIWNAGNAPSMSFWKILGCVATQNNAGKAIWYQVGGGWIDCLVDQNCNMTCAAARQDTGCGTTSGSTTVTDTHAVSGDAGLPIGNLNLPSGTTITTVTPGTGYTVSAAATGTASSQTFYVGGATVSPWYVSGAAGAFNSVKFSRMRCTGNYSPAVPFFSIDNASAAGYSANIIFDSITFEVCVGGSVYMTGCVQVTLNQCIHWDATPSANTFSFQVSAGGYPCRDIVLRQSGNIHPNGAYPDFAAASTCTAIVLDSCGTWGIPLTYSSPANQTTVISPAVAGSTAPPPTVFPGTVAVGGNTGATAGMRLAGATASGAPASGTFIAGDVVPDLTGAVWICTAGGTPGTWVRAGAGSPNIQFFTASGTWTKPAGAKTVFAAVLGAGGGGGSGASGTGGTVQSGGAGGGAGVLEQRQFTASDLTSTVTVTVATAPNGGASVTGSSGNTSGNDGTVGGNSSFGTYLLSQGGGPGKAGTTASAVGGFNSFGVAATNLGTGAASSGTGAAGVACSLTVLTAPGGPSGGGITTGQVAGAGAAGNKSVLSNDTTGGAAGVVGGASPTSGTASALANGSCGPAPGSGAASTTGAAQAGADALANTGAGGAGGGASLNGNASGAGGKGGAGWVLVTSYF